MTNILTNILKLKLKLVAIIILYLEIRPLCLDRVISHQQFRVSIVTKNKQTHGMVLFSLMFVLQLLCPSIVLSTLCGAPCDHCL